ncbi:MAG: hypothetical protein WCK02_06120 [Bacteroidota bacterium]
MKTVINYLLALVLFSSVLVSCEPDTVAPDASQPDTDPREVYVGNWLCTENSKLAGQQTFTVSISLNPSNSTEVLIANFYLFGNDQKARALVAGNNISIPSQSLCNFTISGSGYIDNNKTTINWNYYVKDSQQNDTCTAVYAKK